jgi:hypothetical protein
MKAITLDDINKYLTTIRINFENAYKTQTDDERKILLQSWYVILKDYPKEVCDKAVIEAIKYAKFAPRIGDIVEQIEKMRVAFEKDENELWSELTRVLPAVARNTYHYRFNAVDYNGLTQGENARRRNEAIFERLSPELKEYCRDIGGLIALAEFTDDQLTYERGRFMRNMPEVRKRAQTRQALPENVAGYLKSTATLIASDIKLLKGSDE